MPTSVDDAVGVPQAKWFIAIVNNRSEKAVAKRLDGLGVENYLPVQEELRIWQNGKKAKVEVVMIPSKLFIRCTERQRRDIVKYPFIFRFMTNRSATATNSGNRPLAVVPEAEIAQLKFMLGASNVPITFSEQFVKGEKVEVLRGPLKGLTGEILKDADGAASRLYVNIDFLGSASVEIDANDVKPIR